MSTAVELKPGTCNVQWDGTQGGRCTDTQTEIESDLGLLFLGHDYTNPVTVRFSQPVYELNVFGSGVYVCADYGQATASGSAGSTTLALMPVDPEDCPRGEEDGGVQRTNATYVEFPPDFPVTSVTITVMSPLEYPRDCQWWETGPCVEFAGASYTVGFREPLSPPGDDATFVVSCSPNAVTRRSDVACTGRLSQRLPYTVVQKVAEAEGHTYVDNREETKAAGQDVIWSGPAIVDTKVTMRVRIQTPSGLQELVDDESFTVQPRTWTALTMPGRPTPQVGSDQNLTYPPAFEQGGQDVIPDGRLGLTVVGYNSTRSSVSAGPNTNWFYVLDPTTIDGVAIYTSRALEPGDPFYEEQHGVPLGQLIGVRFCSRGDMNTLKQQVLRHENAHYDAYVAYFSATDVQSQFERTHMYADIATVGQPGGLSLSELKKAWNATLDAEVFNASQAYQERTVHSHDRVVLRCKLQYPGGKRP